MARASALILATALALGALAGTAAAALKRGARGHEVVKVQRWLNQPADGIFGRSTSAAVKRFQRRHGLRADGVVGPATWAALRRGHRAAQRRSPVRSRGPAVRLLQRALGIAADGVFGPATQAAVKRFQRSRGLSADGVVGRETWAALGHAGVRTVLKRGHLRRASGGAPPTVRRIVAAADRIAGKPYKYGGGHGRWDDSGYDCSGSVSYALHGAGLLDRALSSGDFMSWGAPGKGRRVTIYAHPGHVYMVVDGRRFDTTGRDESGSRWQSRSRSVAGYTARHPPGL
ncbi:MAG TPA: peptidoglycan-binding protein [Solirubrobacteraceae bacterium]|nr:peptidoglycan-binding protein [Solirubrobacteraceae bacterium]